MRFVWVRHGIETFQKRLRTLSVKAEQEGIILNEKQAALEKRRERPMTYYPGFLVPQENLRGAYQRCRTHLSAGDHLCLL